MHRRPEFDINAASAKAKAVLTNSDPEAIDPLTGAAAVMFAKCLIHEVHVLNGMLSSHATTRVR